MTARDLLDSHITEARKLRARFLYRRGTLYYWQLDSPDPAFPAATYVIQVDAFWGRT